MSGKAQVGAFTLLEVMVAVVVLSILAAMATAGYARYKDQAILKQEATNLMVAQATLKLYLYDNNSLPGSLSELKPEYWERAYAQVLDKEAPSPVWVAFLRKWIGEEVEHAGVDDPGGTGGGNHGRPSWDPTGKYLGANPWKILTCPSDKTPPPAGMSYALDPGFANCSKARFEDSANALSTLIFESDDGVTRAYRHGGDKICSTITVGGTIVLDRK